MKENRIIYYIYDVSTICLIILKIQLFNLKQRIVKCSHGAFQMTRLNFNANVNVKCAQVIKYAAKIFQNLIPPLKVTQL